MLLNKNLILNAENFNVSIFRESWFLDEGIFESKDDIDSVRSIFSPAIVQVIYKTLHIVITQKQIVLGLKEETSDIKDFIIIKKIIEKLPHVPYTAMGINFDYLIDDKDYRLSKTPFIQFNSPIMNEFSDESQDPRFGVYMSKNYLNSRLKIDSKPARIKINDEVDFSDYLHLKFNFHLDLKINDNKLIGEFIDNAEKFFEYSKNISQYLEYDYS